MNVYDFDNTILRGDSTVRFILYAMGRPWFWRAAPGILRSGILYLAKREDFLRFKESLFSFLPRAPENAVEAFWEKNMSRVKAFFLTGRRPDDVVISASPRFLVLPAMARLGCENVIATDMDPATGRIRGANCKGEEKVRRFYEAYPGGVIDSFYSDSLSDAPLARIARAAFLVRGEKICPWPWGATACGRDGNMV